MFNWQSRNVRARITRQQAKRRSQLSSFVSFCDEQEARLREQLFEFTHGPRAEARRTFVIEHRGLNVAGNQDQRHGGAE
jgi:hypothetical protein